MSDPIKHECGIALLRLKQPLEYYAEKYGSPMWGLRKMYLLMEKQHNRGQDGAGLANIKFDMQPGQRYISRKRSIDAKPIQEIFDQINQRFSEALKENPEGMRDMNWLKQELPFTGELFLGHLRYGTFGRNNIEACHPFLRMSNWITRNLVVAGNFNLTNVDELFGLLVRIGQHPKERSDTVTVMEKIGHFLDMENEQLHQKYTHLGYNDQQISGMIARHLDVGAILRNAAMDWDGGYAMAGLIGHGDAFVLRDPNGIRPAFWYQDDEVVVVASERPVIQTAFRLRTDDIKEIQPGHALIIKRQGRVYEEEIRPPGERKSCSFERIYFSRGSDRDIYRERLELGRNLTGRVLQEISFDLDNTVFSYIPNTAETAFYGLMKGVEDHLNDRKLELIKQEGVGILADRLSEILKIRARIDKLAIKDVKLRTFITQDDDRDEMVAHVYDVTYGILNKGVDTIVILDDSIVRGTTLRKSIIRMLDRLEPKRIVIVSSAPQIRYPDCYGIDMARMGDFIAFQAAVDLLKERNMEGLLDEVYEQCKQQLSLPKEETVNFVKRIYEPFSEREISDRIAKLLTTNEIRADVSVIYQSIEGLHQACPAHHGDWYFSGDYPTPGGNKVVNLAFVYYMEGRKERPY
jgi:amidophosphoribosyltransferase